MVSPSRPSRRSPSREKPSGRPTIDSMKSANYRAWRGSGPSRSTAPPYRRRGGRLEDEVAPLLAPRIDGEGRPDFSDAQFPAPPDGRRPELPPLTPPVG